MILFDLDDTLYPPKLGVVQRIDGRINRYLEERVGIDVREVDALRRRYWAEFGTTLAGLMAYHLSDPDDYLRFIHDIEIDDLLVRDEPLLALLAEIPGRKAIFTNASRHHARRVLERLGVAAAFEAVIALEDLDYVPKPATLAFERVLGRLETQASGATLIDDNAKNVAAAKALGMRAIWVGNVVEIGVAENGGPKIEGADAVVSSVHELRALFL